MPKRKWETPVYKLRSRSGEVVDIDVTSSCAPGLEPNAAVTQLIPFFRSKGVTEIVDFGAGALRHSFPLLRAGFALCAVEFEEQFRTPACKAALSRAERFGGFSTLIWPRDFINDSRKFDAALLCYVLQTMPMPAERGLALKLMRKKLRGDSFLLWMSRYGQLQGLDRTRQVSDGYFMWVRRKRHSFYREFTTEETHDLLGRYRFRHIRSLGRGGSEQIFLYGKGRATWI